MQVKGGDLACWNIVYQEGSQGLFLVDLITKMWTDSVKMKACIVWIFLLNSEEEREIGEAE